MAGADFTEEDFLRRDMAPRLEEKVQEQVERGTYSARVNRGVLKLYQVYPDLAKDGILVQVLAKSLMALPDTDFALCLHLLPVRAMVLPAVSLLVDLEAKLQAARFQDFWTTANEEDAVALLTPIRGFNTAIRKFIVASLSRAFRTITSEDLQRSLNIVRGRWLAAPCLISRLPHVQMIASSLLLCTLMTVCASCVSIGQEDGVEYARNEGWGVRTEAGVTVISLPHTPQNSPRPRTFQEKIKYEEMVPIVAELLR